MLGGRVIIDFEIVKYYNIITKLIGGNLYEKVLRFDRLECCSL